MPGDMRAGVGQLLAEAGTPAPAASPRFYQQKEGMAAGMVIAVVLLLLALLFRKALSKAKDFVCGILAALLNACCKKDGVRDGRKRSWNEDAVTIGWLWAALIFAGVFLVCVSISQLNGEGFLTVFALGPPIAVSTSGATAGAMYVALLWSLGCLVVGSFLGFLFGVPRVVQAPAAPVDPVQGRRKVPAISYKANTALEEVADWLTKMVVGVSLVQLSKVPGYLDRASAAMSGGYGNTPASKAFGIALIIYFSFVGFLGSYLMTRLYLQKALLLSDTGTLGTAPDKAELSKEEVIALKQARLGATERGRNLTGLAAIAAGKLATEVGFEDLEDAQDYVLWAKAQLNAGEYELAIKAYQEATRKAPADVTIKLEYATAMYLREEARRLKAEKAHREKGGATDQDKADEKRLRRDAALEYRRLLEAAYGAIGNDTPSEVWLDVVKNLTYVYLYNDDRPDDFQEAIRYGEEYLLDPKHVPSGGLLVNLACGYGQRALMIQKDLSAPGKTDAAKAALQRSFQDSRQRALKCIQEALRIDPAWKARFRQLLEKDGSGRGEDKDLQVFEDDAAFRYLLDLPPREGDGVNSTGDGDAAPDGTSSSSTSAESTASGSGSGSSEGGGASSSESSSSSGGS